MIFSIGYGDRSVGQTLDLLQRQGVKFLIDVRSSPYSKHHPDYNLETLERHCADCRIKYVFMGDLLGGRPQSGKCYDDQGRVNYTALEQEPYFKKGIERLKSAAKQGIEVALICSERRPEQCHRSKLIGRVLAGEDIPIKHIDFDGKLIDQEEVINRILAGQSELFGVPPEVTRSRGVYRKDQND